MERRPFLLKTAVTVIVALNFGVQVQGYSVECSRYRFLNESNRAQTYETLRDDWICDISLLGWYRFGGEAGTQMADSCVLINHCGTHRPGWLNGRHPSVADGAVKRQVCFTGSSDCMCHATVSITVRNCGEFYVYYLKRPRLCYLRYCGNGIKPTLGTTPSRSAYVVSSSSVSSMESQQYAPGQEWLPRTTQSKSASVAWSSSVSSLESQQYAPDQQWLPKTTGRVESPTTAGGTALGICSDEGVWNKANFIGCSSAEFIKLDAEMEAILKGFESEINAQQVLSQLANASQPTKNDSLRPLEIYKKDLIIAVDILVKLAEYNTNTANVSSTEDFENYAQVASNLLDLKNKKTWKELAKVGQGRSQMLVKALDDYGLGVAATFNEPTKSKVVLKKNLNMRIDSVGENSPLKERGLKVAYNQSSIHLPAQAFSSTEDTRVVTLIYLTLHEVLSLPKEDESGQPFSPDSTTIVSSTVSPRPPSVLSQPVKVVLRRSRKISSTRGISVESTCVFWRPEESAIWKTSGCRVVPNESNATITTCECDHLTIFAALMDPYGSHLNKPLEIISIVGCSVSLVAVVITVAVFLIFWRELKSPGVKVLLNLSAAIAVSCALVIFEGSARNKMGCPIVAASLHYFLLALFSWMLCEGMLHYLVLVKVVGGSAEDKTKFFCIFGWGFPAIVVAISLAITETNGYGNTVCWLDVKSGLIWAFIGPAIFVILINVVVYVLVIRSMMRSSLTRNKTQIEKVKAGVKASVVMFPLLGITWLFGLLSFSSETMSFKYLFAILNSLQGLMIFVFKVALNRQVHDAVKRRNGKKIPTNPKATQRDQSALIQATKGHSTRADCDYEHVPVTTEPRKDKLELKTLLKQNNGQGINDGTHLRGNLLSHTDE